METDEIISKFINHREDVISFVDDENIRWNIQTSNSEKYVYIKAEKNLKKGVNYNQIRNICESLNNVQYRYSYSFDAVHNSIAIRFSVYASNVTDDIVENIICNLAASLESVACLIEIDAEKDNDYELQQ